jgi:hypothetical protein
MSSRFKALLLLAVIALGMLFTWFFGNFFYDLLWAFLSAHGVLEADLIAMVTAHLIPFILASVLITGVYFFVHYELSKSLGSQNGGAIAREARLQDKQDLRRLELKSPFTSPHKENSSTSTAFRRFREEQTLAFLRGSLTPKPVPDVLLGDAIWRAFLKSWDKPPHSPNPYSIQEPWPGYWHQVNDFTMKAVRQSAFDGQLPVWGRKTENSVAERLAEPVRQAIPADYWEYYWVPVPAILSSDTEKVVTQADPHRENKVHWRDLWTHRATVEKLWPESGTHPSIEASERHVEKRQRVLKIARTLRDDVATRIAFADALISTGEESTLIENAHGERIDVQALRSVDSAYLTDEHNALKQLVVHRVDELDMCINDIMQHKQEYIASPLMVVADYRNKLQSIAASLEALIEIVGQP